MKRKSLMLILSLVTLFAFTLAACSNPTGNDGGGNAGDQTGDNGNGSGDPLEFEFNHFRIGVHSDRYDVLLATESPVGFKLKGEDILYFYVSDGEEDTADQQIDPGTYTYEDAESDFVPILLREGWDEDADTYHFLAETKTEEESGSASDVDTYEQITSGTLVVAYDETTATYTFDWTLDFASGNSVSRTYTGSPDEILIR